VVIDPKRSTTFTPSNMRSRQKHGALEGLKVAFAIKSVYLRGAEVGARASGRMVRPSG